MTSFLRLLLLGCLILLCGTSVFSQAKIQITGTVKSADGHVLELVGVTVKGSPSGTMTDSLGHFVLETHTALPFVLVFSSVGYNSREIVVASSVQLQKPLAVELSPKTEMIGHVQVKGNLMRDQSMSRLDPNLTSRVPDASGGSIESLVKTQMGVASNNELSSQYRVRGGNYDENLVYVNDIEIYRPFLVRSGQQEGLSFANPDMVSSLLFSPGGFNASYGDKMSSVLDIKYKKPRERGGSVQASLLGASAHVEGITGNRKFSHISGVRYKTNRYLLGSLDTKGDYSPTFFDAQSFLAYTFSPRWEVNALGYFSRNDYLFVPTNRETRFGTISEVKQLMVYFEGQEKDRFMTGFGALALNHTRNNSWYKLTLSGFRTFEEETYDILGEYWLQELDPTDGQAVDNSAPVTGIGVGGYLQHARNELLGRVMNVALKGTHQMDRHQLTWEAKLQTERFTDYLNEWEMVDSAGYSIPYTGNMVNLSYAYNADLEVNSTRATLYAMDSYTSAWGESAVTLNYGVRLNYWDYNDELLVSPRVNLLVRPDWERDVQLRFATGVYYQSPFYKELRLADGTLNPSVKAQRSIHVMAGGDWFFGAWGRPFKFTAEAYYKHLANLVSYQVDNVRIRYSGRNDAKGYATGIDFKVNGEFVEGVESWVSLGIMKTMEDIEGDAYIKTLDDGSMVTVEPGYIPRPSDQRVNFAMFLQDYLPNNPSFKVHFNLVYGTGLPFGPPKSERYKAVFRTPPYRRADIGFSKDLLYKRDGHDLLFRNFWIGLEVFNLFDISNTISYYWVTDVDSRQYAVPNYLTSRRLSLHVRMDF
ncbi:MAG: TonB-dependent receptor [Breznakibacter sp.]